MFDPSSALKLVSQSVVLAQNFENLGLRRNSSAFLVFNHFFLGLFGDRLFIKVCHLLVKRLVLERESLLDIHIDRVVVFNRSGERPLVGFHEPFGTDGLFQDLDEAHVAVSKVREKALALANIAHVCVYQKVLEALLGLMKALELDLLENVVLELLLRQFLQVLGVARCAGSTANLRHVAFAGAYAAGTGGARFFGM